MFRNSINAQTKKAIKKVWNSMKKKQKKKETDLMTGISTLLFTYFDKNILK
jgi:hypothetical protein